MLHTRLLLLSLSCVRPFATPWTAEHPASLFIPNSQTLVKLMSIESVMSFNHLFCCCLLLLLPSMFPSIRVFPMSRLFPLGGRSIGASASVSVLPINIQDWFPLGLTGLISLLKQKKKKLSIKKNFETLENFRKVERILQWIPTYPSHMFTNVILPYLLYMYTSIYLFFPFIYLLNHLKVQRSCYRDYDILPLNMSPKS